MKELLMIAVGAAMVNNVVLSQFLVCVHFSVCRKKWILLPGWAELLFLF